MKKVIYVLKWACAFVLAAGIIIFSAAAIVSSSILSKDYMLNKLEETNYYINTYTQVIDDFENYIYQSGLDKEVIDDIVSIEDIKKDTKTIISNIYDGVNVKIDVDKVKENLNNNISKSLEGSNISLATQKAIDSFVDKITEQYKDSILHTNFEETIYEFIQKTEKFVGFARTVSITIIGISIIFILSAYYKKIWKNLAILGIPFVSAGLFYELVDIYIKSRVKIANIVILNDAITITIRTILENVFNTIKITGLLFIGVGALLILIGNIVRAKKYKAHTKHKESK